MATNQALWWQSGVIYQIYPRSFKDSNGDGVGDLAGIIEKLDYLRWLGVDAIWLSPFYPSPQADFGYDVADYTDVDPLYGNLADFDRLVKEAHARDLKLIIDLVPNHTSDEHEWFQQARSSASNPKRDWYVWQDPRPNGEPPNNWTSHFGGSAWELDQASGQYYLHLFHVKQPDLNWRNPLVRQAIYDVMHFWFKRGVDGFRIDVLSALIKDELFRDNPPNPNWKEGDPDRMQYLYHYTEDQPEVHEVMQEMRQVADQYPERVLIGESYLPYPKLMRYYGELLDEIHLPFNFGLLSFVAWSAEQVQQKIDEYEAVLPTSTWPNWVLGNHDRPRIASRIGKARDRLAQMLLLTLRGTPTCYYGDELGMVDVDVPLELRHDPVEVYFPGRGRDPERTPMQWSTAANAGFCPPNTLPWLPLAADYSLTNVETEQQDLASILNLVHNLMEVRKTRLALSLGRYRSLNKVAEDCLAYMREFEGDTLLVLLNFSSQSQNLTLTGLGQASLILSTHPGREGEMVDPANLHLKGYEGVIIEISSVSQTS